MEALLRKAKNLADCRRPFALCDPKRYGGKDGSNLWMAVIREHFAAKGLGLHNDLQNEHSIVAICRSGPCSIATARRAEGDDRWLRSPESTHHFVLPSQTTAGRDAMETKAVQATRDNVKGWIINGEKM